MWCGLVNVVRAWVRRGPHRARTATEDERSVGRAARPLSGLSIEV